MIRFAPQADKPPVAPQARAPKPAAPSDDVRAENAAPVASLMLIPELGEASGETTAKNSKRRSPKKQKTDAAPESAAIQLDLNA